MPIHDQGYRRYGGSAAPRGQAWSVITRAGLRTMLAKRMFLGLLLVAWFPFFVRAVQIYARTPTCRRRRFSGRPPKHFGSSWTSSRFSCSS